MQVKGWQFALACLSMGMGLFLAGPIAWTLATHRSTEGQLFAIYPEPVAEDRVRLVMAFDFRLPSTGDHGEVHAIGYGRADAYGRPLPDPVVSRDDLQGWRDRLLASERRDGRVLYDPEDPIESARFVAGGGFWRYQVGVILLLAPSMVWCSLWLTQRFAAAMRRRPDPRPRRRRTSDGDRR